MQPNNHWHLVEKGENDIDTDIPDKDILEMYDKSFEDTYSDAEKMLDAWIGCVGLRDASDERMEKYKDYIEKLDYLGYYRTLKETIDYIDYKERDICTIAELNLLCSALKKTQNKTKYILEVGGGYGRIAEGLCNSLSGLKYVMVDAVPGSIIYSYEYLRTMFPEKKIGLFYNDDEFDLEEFDIYIIPAWQFEKENKYLYDMCINISSMQEMSQYHVDYYLELFNKVSVEGGIVYIQNSHDYVFKGTWNYPDNWERIFMSNTPASWTSYFPTEIFVKRDYVCTEWNNCVIAGYEWMINEKEKLNSIVNEHQSRIWQLEYAEKELFLEREKNAELSLEISRLKDEVMKKRFKIKRIKF